MQRYRSHEQAGPDGQVRIFGEFEIAGLQIAWEEPPVAWIAERWFEQTRVFSRGPFKRMTTRAWLEDLGTTSKLELELDLESRHLFGGLIAKRMVAVYEANAGQLLENAARLIDAEQPQLFQTSYQPDPSTLRRTEGLAADIDATPWSHGLAPRLVEYINQRQELDLWTMRPIAIARQWQQPDQDVIELFLQSVRAGLLESRWDVLCPRCRVAPARIRNMSELPAGVHCDACNIDFDADFTRNVELSFSPSPAVRPIETGFFCRSGPGVTPHIKAQCPLAPGEEKRLPLALHPDEFRLRTLEAGGECTLSWPGGKFPRVLVDGETVEIDAGEASDELVLVNTGTITRTVVIESRAWIEDVLTAEQVTTLQVFRDLFSDQVLRPGDEVSIRNISFMFTDLVGSSALFARRGDAEAYHLVREHFALLGDIVRKHRGNIVKTVGDGIHAAFALPDDALRAAIDMQNAMPEFNRRLQLEDSAIRIGLHSGRSIAVTLNDRLDYYGEAVNLAARLEGLGRAGEITMSQGFADDPAVAEVLRGQAIDTRSTEIKGFNRPQPIVGFTPVAFDKAQAAAGDGR